VSSLVLALRKNLWLRFQLIYNFKIETFSIDIDLLYLERSPIYLEVVWWWADMWARMWCPTFSSNSRLLLWFDVISGQVLRLILHILELQVIALPKPIPIKSGSIYIHTSWGCVDISLVQPFKKCHLVQKYNLLTTFFNKPIYACLENALQQVLLA
jgi:hypothetical protein